MLFLSLKRGLACVLLASVFCFTASADSASDALAAIPPCGLQCITENLPTIGCGLTDLECQCSSKNSTQILQSCLEQLCTFNETFEILRVQATLCNRPHNSRTNWVRINAYVTGIIPVIVIAMRFASRHLGGNKYWWDDWLHLTSVVLTVPMTVALLLNCEAGLGRHVWDLNYSNIVDIRRWTYISTIFWTFEILILKYSILCLYLRIFPNVWLRRAIFAFMAFTACFTLPLIGLAIFQCVPVHAIWDLDARSSAKCIDWIVVLRLTVVYEIIAEVVLFSLPVPIVWKLQMKMSKKIQLMIFFGLGICVIGVGIARVPFLPGAADTADPTYTIVGASITGYASSGVGHVTAAVPTVKALFKFLFRGFKHDTKASSNYVKENAHDTGGKRSHRSLQDAKNDSVVSSRSLENSQRRSQASSRNDLNRDPYNLSSILDADNDEGIVELRSVQTPTDSRLEIPQAKCSCGSNKRGAPGPELDDVASSKPILFRKTWS